MTPPAGFEHPDVPGGEPATISPPASAAGATAYDWRLLLALLPSLRLSQETVARLSHSIEAILAAEVVFEPVGVGHWRIGQGGTIRVYTEVPAGLPAAYEALRQGGVLYAADDNAVRMRIRRTAKWLVREALAPLLAERVRRICVCRTRIPDSG